MGKRISKALRLDRAVGDAVLELDRAIMALWVAGRRQYDYQRGEWAQRVVERASLYWDEERAYGLADRLEAAWVERWVQAHTAQLDAALEAVRAAKRARDGYRVKQRRLVAA